MEAEQKAFQLATEHAEKAGNVAEVQYLSLAHNSLQRLHASQLESEDESEQTEADVDAGDVEEDDDDDPFFMPMPGAIKWADADKFRELAAPLAPEQPADKQFMIMMEEGRSQILT